MSITPEQAARSLREFAKSLDGAIASPLTSAGERAEAEARRDFLSRDPGQSIFTSRGRTSSVPKLLIEATPASGAGGTVTVNLVLKGMAALLEAGGRTKAPARGAIRPVAAEVLRFEGKAGIVFAREARHRGSRVDRHETAARALERTAGGLPRAVDAAIQSEVRAHGLN